MVRDHERTGARTAFAPIDGDEVDAAGAGRHELREVGPESGVADRRLVEFGHHRKVDGTVLLKGLVEIGLG